MCNCGTELNKALAEKNGRLAMALQVTSSMGLRSRLCIATEKIDKTKRKPVPTVVANYCPFCGEKLADDSETPNELSSGARP
ncbi:hypothetical protein [Azonexus fungiphilus]|uniref:hypothetical protein n=1 Tax=Azonexus fungiphilus TaxID=146940 RepID=UPI00156B9BEC|nr:hypothetical protein [Azonexus fungiphilus]NHC05897.1 hypothetical protein [Azonexus fungiphilus]